MTHNLTLAQVQALIAAADQIIALTSLPMRRSWAPDMPASVDDARIELLKTSHLCKLRIEAILEKYAVQVDTPA